MGDSDMKAFDRWQNALRHLNDAAEKFLDASSALQLAQPPQSGISDYVIAYTRSHHSVFESSRAKLNRSHVVLSRMHNASVLISTLPSEILHHIFSLSLEFKIPLGGARIPGTCEPYKPWTISWVCSRWRQLVIQTPSYWANILLEGLHLAGTDVSHLIDRIKLCLERCRGFPINVVLPRSNLTKPHQRKALASILQPLASSIISVASPGVLDDPLFLDICKLVLRHGKVDSVKKLAIFVEKESNESPRPWRLVMQLTGLVQLDLHGIGPSARLTIDKIATILT
ncbi:hypothetical protein FRC09_016701, partial [Ceratobasidium sp. 395]